MPRHTLINTTHVRQFLLDYAGRSRSHRFTQVGVNVYEDLEAAIRQWCRRCVDRQPSVGRTIK